MINQRCYFHPFYESKITCKAFQYMEEIINIAFWKEKRMAA
jgi:hypothetical protein